MRLIVILTVLLILTPSNNWLDAHELPESRQINWHLAGLKDTTTQGFTVFDMDILGAATDGTSPNDSLIAAVLNIPNLNGKVLKFGAGNYLFNSTIYLPSNTIIKGEGAEHTTFISDLGGSSPFITVQGSVSKALSPTITQSAEMGSNFIISDNASLLSSGDWIRISLEDGDLITSSWAAGSVGQIVQVSAVEGDTIFIDSPLRMDYDIKRNPYTTRLLPSENVGIECLKILRMDDTAPQQSSNIFFSYTANCWVRAIESENCTFSHITASNSTNINISGSYFHHAFGYGGGGRAYGVTLQYTSGEILVEDNIFEHLRHSVLLQAGPNGNVIAYNYSLDPYWDSFPNNSTGELVLHGNYPYANLFENNICRNIVIDNSHGPNGPNNTIFRNRAEGYGIFFSADNSPNQNIIGNVITNTDFPYSLVNYTILGDNHYLFGNYNKGSIAPTGTEIAQAKSLAYLDRPEFLEESQWVGIGSPNAVGANTIPAYDRYLSNNIFAELCDKLGSAKEDSGSNSRAALFPNPFADAIEITTSIPVDNIKIITTKGHEIANNSFAELHTDSLDSAGFHSIINSESWAKGVYIIVVTYPDGDIEQFTMVKEK